MFCIIINIIIIIIIALDGAVAKALQGHIFTIVAINLSETLGLMLRWLYTCRDLNIRVPHSVAQHVVVTVMPGSTPKLLKKITFLLFLNT